MKNTYMEWRRTEYGEQALRFMPQHISGRSTFTFAYLSPAVRHALGYILTPYQMQQFLHSAKRYQVPRCLSLWIILRLSLPLHAWQPNRLSATVGYISRNGNGTRLNDKWLVLTFHMTVSTDISRWCLADYPSQSFSSFHVCWSLAVNTRTAAHQTEGYSFGS